MKDFTFQGKTVVITGGAQGLGFGIAKTFLESGANVHIWDYSADALEVAKKELSHFSTRVTCTAMDVTNRQSCADAASTVTNPLHILINNAGITRDKSFKKMTDADFDAVIQTNLTGLYNVTKSLFDRFDTAAPKRIINMASIVALYGNFGQTNYVAAKAGVIGLTKTWAREFARGGFTVNAIAPGFIETKMTAAMPAEVLSQITSKVPVGRMGKPEDIAAACLYLASDAAAYVNGVTLSVDGGLVL